MGDLQGLLVVSVEQAVAAPYASMKLADAGARVIKIERPDGDFARRYDSYVNGDSAYFVWLNRGKQSVRLDLRARDDRALLDAMLARADVFIKNLAPKQAERLGFGAAELRDRHPTLIVCSISGYGDSGPLADQKAYDLLVQAEAGLAAISGTAEAPARVGISICDIAAGVTAYQAILEALIGRARTGGGRAIEVSLFHALADWMNVPYLQHRYGGSTLARQGLQHPTIAPYGGYRCADGKVLLIAIQNEREWEKLCRDVLGQPELLDSPRFAGNIARVAHREEIDGIVGAFMRRADREANIARLRDAGIAYGRLSSMEEFRHHPQNRFIRVASEGGPVEVLAPGAVVAGAAPVCGGAIPRLGEHDESVRAEFAVPRASG